VDCRTREQKDRDRALGCLGGNLIVVVPGHGQTVDGPRNLTVAAARLSRSRLAWCIDPVPAAGGDRTEGRALGTIVRQRLAALFPAQAERQPDPPVKATVAGWSHGGAEALLAAAADGALFQQWLGLCPTGMIARSVPGLAAHFTLEALQVVWQALANRDWRLLQDVIRVGGNLVRGAAGDLVSTRAPRRLVDDVRWACYQVAGPDLGYGGEAAILFAREDSVIRWRDLVPGCPEADGIEGCVPGLKETYFPGARQVQVRVIKGNHLSPESEAGTFVRAGLELLGQLDSGAASSKVT
jgi:hypothetical protein